MVFQANIDHEEDIFQILEDRHDLSYTRTSRKRSSIHCAFRAFPKPKVESSTSVPNAASTVSSEVLKKILSASKGAKPGTPQFVVFAPVPSEEGNIYQNPQQPQSQRSAGSDIALLASEFNQQPIQRQSRPSRPQQVSQTYSQNPQAVYSEATQSNYPHQSHNRQDPVQNPVEANFNQMQHNYNQAQSNYQQPQQQISNYPNQQLPYPGQQQPPAAMDRSGHFPPLGISLSLGNGGHGGHGKGLLGGHSPLGIISSVLSPL
ncbi:uncharacterized protein CEXT_200021 [Caerostris extrusa]|uniref:Uncharacterized protein n=1 Tax=Caerostris extrusa TaxID=172846 RepID=A0AAV4YAJ6_CAEEX|nr:uncharacterized protein CEXT_200021 [Caerostris extrusa]